MDLNHIELPLATVAALYSETLVAAGEQAEPGVQKAPKNKEEIVIPAEIPKEEPAWKYLGNNQQNILILVHAKDFTHLPDDELELLTTMLGACKLSLADVAILNRKNHPGASYKELAAYFNSRVVLLFDVEPNELQLPVSFPAFQVQAVTNTTFLLSPSLQELIHDKVLKSKLWVCLRRVFNV